MFLELSNRPEATPAKDQRAVSIGGLASPRLAACAPSMAALPLSSCTTSPVPSQQAKAASYQKTPRSIKSWLSPRQGSPSQKSHLQCKVLSSCSQSSVVPLLPWHHEPNAGWRRPTAHVMNVRAQSRSTVPQNSPLLPKGAGPSLAFPAQLKRVCYRLTIILRKGKHHQDRLAKRTTVPG